MSGSVEDTGNCVEAKRVEAGRKVSVCRWRRGERSIKPGRKVRFYIMESLILAQNERWRRVLSMQVERQGE